MARLLTVVNERKKLRSEYRKQLEDEYIAYQKAEEAKAYKEELEALKSKGVKVPLTEDEVKEMLKAKREKRISEYDKKLEELKARTLREQSVVSPLLNEGDLKLAA